MSDAWQAFKAGFSASSEGFNGEMGASEEDIQERFEIWQCDHSFTEWRYNDQGEGGYKENVFRERECKHCPKTERVFERLEE